MVPDEYLNIKSAAQYLGVSETKVRQLVNRGLLAVWTDPLDDRKRLIKRGELDGLKIPKAKEEKRSVEPLRRE